MFAIRPECAADGPAIETLLDRCFGVDRLAKTSYRFRDGIEPLHELCFVAESETAALVGAIRYWPIRLDRCPALLLGPLAIDPDRQGRGVGRALVFHSLEKAHGLGHRLVFLVGDPAYYARFGFGVAPPSLVMPGEAAQRLNVRSLEPDGRLPAAGTLRPAEGPPIGRRAHPRTASPRASAAKAIASVSSFP